jgi:hypothetical protein
MYSEVEINKPLEKLLLLGSHRLGSNYLLSIGAGIGTRKVSQLTQNPFSLLARAKGIDRIKL